MTPANHKRKIGGTYRIDEVEFPAPITSWTPQIIGARLNGLPALNTYYIHEWQWPSDLLAADEMEELLNKFYEQMATGQLAALETDEHDADSALLGYGTVTYTDFIIQEVQPVTRGLPHYDSPRARFEIYVLSQV